MGSCCQATPEADPLGDTERRLQVASDHVVGARRRSHGWRMSATAIGSRPCRAEHGAHRARLEAVAAADYLHGNFNLEGVSSNGDRGLAPGVA